VAEVARLLEIQGHAKGLTLEVSCDPQLPHAVRGDPRLAALAECEKEAYELMLGSAGKVFDLSEEKDELRDRYGRSTFGQSCLIARRLVERGVRFVQIWYYAWDMHQNINEILPKTSKATDQPSAALVKDLKQRGMLGDTLVFWGGEMGRLPVVQTARSGKFTPGRDHNTDGFSIWLAGGGVKGGHIHGATDDFGLFAVQDIVRHTDYLSTVMHLFGMDANKLIYKRNGRNETILDGQEGQVVKGILA
jgi:uncharacterized protein (DUF1501 family)